MDAGAARVMRRATFLWIGAGLILGFNIFAAYAQSQAAVYAALAASGMFALVGIAFGIWAARVVTRPAGGR